MVPTVIDVSVTPMSVAPLPVPGPHTALRVPKSPDTPDFPAGEALTFFAAPRATRQQPARQPILVPSRIPPTSPRRATPHSSTPDTGRRRERRPRPRRERRPRRLRERHSVGEVGEEAPVIAGRVRRVWFEFGRPALRWPVHPLADIAAFHVHGEPVEPSVAF